MRARQSPSVRAALSGADLSHLHEDGRGPASPRLHHLSPPAGGSVPRGRRRELLGEGAAESDAFHRARRGQNCFGYERLDLESTSLQSIDISASAKALSFERVNCPALREIVCGPVGPYGNGLALLVPNDGGDGFVRWDPQRDPDDPGALCLFGTCWNDQEVPSLIEIPSACVVTWKQWGGWCAQATTSTTMGEVAKAYVYGHAAAPVYSGTHCIDTQATAASSELRSCLFTFGFGKLRMRSCFGCLNIFANLHLGVLFVTLMPPLHRRGAGGSPREIICVGSAGSRFG